MDSLALTLGLLLVVFTLSAFVTDTQQLLSALMIVAIITYAITDYYCNSQIVTCNSVSDLIEDININMGATMSVWILSHVPKGILKKFLARL